MRIVRMKISKRELERIIKEEIKGISEVGMCHDPEDGTFTDCKTGAVKSLSKKGAKDSGVDTAHVGRGVITAKGKTAAKMGMNFGKDECGRKSIQAGGNNNINPRYKCSDYKERYAEGLSNLDTAITIGDVLEAAERSLNGLDEDITGECSQQRSKWLQSLLRSLNAVALASKGDLLPKKESAEPENGKSEDRRKKTKDAERRARTKKMKSQAGVYFPKSGFSKSERELLNTNSLWEE
jgi:hypothetical protein